jgi:hypothetical protein
MPGKQEENATPYAVGSRAAAPSRRFLPDGTQRSGARTLKNKALALLYSFLSIQYQFA